MKTLLLILALCACRADALFKPIGYTFFAPPPVYATWWAKTAECAGVWADFGRVGWAVMEDDSLNAFWCDDIGYPAMKIGGLCHGAWVAPHLIILARSRIENEYVVRHEMLHDLLQSPEHTSPLFLSCLLLSGDRPTAGRQNAIGGTCAADF